MFHKKFTITANPSQPGTHSVHINFDQHGGFTVKQSGGFTVTQSVSSVSPSPSSQNAKSVMPSLPSPRSQNVTSVMPKSTDFPILTPFPPLPPNWHERYQNTVASLQNYKLFPVEPNTLEFTTIASLLNPLQISDVQQVVNPSLWARFVNARKEMLKSKCNDLELLSKLQLDETELMASYQHSANFETSPKVLEVPFNDNMALLFHCTRNPSNIENILRQGLDERMGSTEGLLGKGIYFTDNAKKCIQYDGCDGVVFIFAVLLGDCLEVDGPMYDFVREPEKLKEQKRSFTDLNFDSIAGRPGADRSNEYVIYNRYQCCPLYKIKYSPARFNKDLGVYAESRKYSPPMGWTSTANNCVTPAQVQKSWPFYAKTIFAKMENLVENEEKKKDLAKQRSEK